MKRESRTKALSLFFFICLSFVVVANGFCEEYEALKGLKSVKAVFDVRIGTPKSAALHLKLIHDTFKDKSIMSITKKPAFVVEFIGPSVKLVSKNRDGFSPEDQKGVDEIARHKTCTQWLDIPDRLSGEGVFLGPSLLI